MRELWKPVVGYEGLYEVSNLGRVRSLPRKGTKGGIVNVSYSNNKHYAHIPLTKDSISKTTSLHRVVALAWVPNPTNKPQVNHIDGNKLNNSASNLEWVTNLENMRHSIKTGLRSASPEAAIEARMTGVIQKYRGEVIAMYPCIKFAQYLTGICNQNIFKVCQGKRHTAGGYEWEFGFQP